VSSCRRWIRRGSNAPGLTLAPVGGRFVATNVPLRVIIAAAFSIRDYRLDGGPIQGFALVLARSDARLGERLRRSDVPCDKPESAAEPRPFNPTVLPPCGQAVGSDHSIRINTSPFAMFANTLAQHVSAPLEDRTRLTGNFVVELDWAPNRPGAPATGDEVVLFTALQEQLGLRLQRERVDVDVVVIDRIERPTEVSTVAAARISEMVGQAVRVLGARGVAQLSSRHTTSHGRTIWPSFS
jgi:hypothetical protein